METAEAIVNVLLENDEIDPKSMALRTRTQPDSAPTDIVQAAANAILVLPHTGEAAMQQFYADATRITNEMVSKLEMATGRKALEGLREMMRASMPKPWNREPGYRISRLYARQLAASFRANSKPIKR